MTVELIRLVAIWATYLATAVLVLTSALDLVALKRLGIIGVLGSLSVQGAILAFAQDWHGFAWYVAVIGMAIAAPIAGAALVRVLEHLLYWRVSKRHGEFDRGPSTSWREAYAIFWN